MEPQQNEGREPVANKVGVGGAREGWSEAQGWDRASMDEAFVQALRRAHVREIGKYQVYSDYRENETVVFIHDPSGQSEHKYIFACTDTHTYIVAAPVRWTGLHRDILGYVRKAAGENVYADGGGYVTPVVEGGLIVDRRSQDFGEGDHVRARKAFEDAVRATGSRSDSH